MPWACGRLTHRDLEDNYELENKLGSNLNSESFREQAISRSIPGIFSAGWPVHCTGSELVVLVLKPRKKLRFTRSDHSTLGAM
jgi:hypothetical protein